MKIIKHIISIILTLLLVGWLIILFTDYQRVNNQENPKFCLNKETKTYDDGTVEICNGLLYKVYKYDRSDISAMEFGPFFAKEKDVEQLKNQAK